MPNASSSGRTLVIAPATASELLLAQSLLKLLCQQRPDSPIDLLAPDWALALTERMPEVAANITTPLAATGLLSLSKRYQLARRLTLRDYERAFVLPDSLVSAFIPALAGIASRVGWRGQMRFGLLNDIRKFDSRRYGSVTERFVALAFAPGAVLPDSLPVPQLQIQAESLPRLLQVHGLALERPVFAVCLGAEFSRSKHAWPVAQYAKLIAQLAANGAQVWLFGSKAEAVFAGHIIAALPEPACSFCFSVTGRSLNLADVIDLLAAAEAVLSGDEFFSRVSAALDKPLLAIHAASPTSVDLPHGDKVVGLTSKDFDESMPATILSRLAELSGLSLPP